MHLIGLSQNVTWIILYSIIYCCIFSFRWYLKPVYKNFKLRFYLEKHIIWSRVDKYRNKAKINEKYRNISKKNSKICWVAEEFFAPYIWGQIMGGGVNKFVEPFKKNLSKIINRPGVVVFDLYLYNRKISQDLPKSIMYIYYKTTTKCVISLIS